MAVIKFKILNKKGGKKEISPLKALDLLLWHPIQVLVLLTGAFSVSLSLLKVGTLGYVAMDVAALCWTVQLGVGSGFLSPVFPWCGRPVWSRWISGVLSPGGCFVSSCWSLLPTGKVATKRNDHSLPDSPRWSDMFLFSLVGSGVTP
jgi:hypothetical protein